MADTAAAATAAAAVAGLQLSDGPRRVGCGRGQDLGEAKVRRALMARLNRRFGGLLPSPTEITELFDASAFHFVDEAGDAEDAAIADEEDAAIAADTESCVEAGANGVNDGAEAYAAAQRLPGRRIDAVGLRAILSEVSALAVARISAEAPEGSPLPAAARERLRECVEDAVTEAVAVAATMSLRQFNDNAFGSVFDTLYRLLHTDRDE